MDVWFVTIISNGRRNYSYNDVESRDILTNIKLQYVPAMRVKQTITF